MSHRAACLALMLLAACDKPAAVPPTSGEAAITAAERRAVADVDAALAEARAAPATASNTGTKGDADQFAR